MNPATCVDADKIGFKKLDLSLSSTILSVCVSVCSNSFKTIGHRNIKLDIILGFEGRISASTYN